MTSEKQRLLRRIKAGLKITGQDAIAAAGLGLGELYRSENGSFALRLFNPSKQPMKGKQK